METRKRKIPTISIEDAVVLFGSRKALAEYLGMTVGSISMRLSRGHKTMVAETAYMIAIDYPKAVTWKDA